MIMWERQLCIITLSLGLSAPVAAALPEPGTLVWHSITFGQSTDVNFATNVLADKIGRNETLLAGGKAGRQKAACSPRPSRWKAVAASWATATMA